MSIPEREERKTKSKAKILLAEDSKPQQKIITRFLEQQGYEVAVAGDGLDAVNKVYEFRPDLLLLDIEMPHMNGFQVCRLLKADQATAYLPIVMLTSKGQASDRFWGLKTGANSYVTKDSPLPKIGETIKETLEETPLPEATQARPPTERGKIDVLYQLNELLDRKLYEATIVNEISELAALIQDYHQTINTVMVILGKIIEYDAAGVYLVDENEVIVSTRCPVSEEYIEDIKTRVLAEAQRPTGQTELRMVVFDEFRFAKRAPDAVNQITDFTSYPLTAKGEVIGHLCFSSAKQDAITSDVDKIIEIVKNPVTIVIDNTRLYEETKKLAITDGLTKIYNFRHFLELLGDRFVQSEEKDQQLSLIMIDIDFFKRVNDRFGHLVGDEVLRELVVVINNGLREQDIVARYGGEEFAIILPNTPTEDARAVADRLRNSVAGRPFNSSKGLIPITISLGIATHPRNDIQSQFDLISKADQALYNAKESGRNKVCEWS